MEKCSTNHHWGAPANKSFQFPDPSRFVLSIFLTLVTSAPAGAQIADGFHTDHWREPIIEYARPWITRWRALHAGVMIDDRIRIPTPIDPPLQATLYQPRTGRAAGSRMGTILLMLPYGRQRYGEATRAGVEFARAGFSVLTVDLRGYDDQAHVRPLPWQGVRDDAKAMLDWIVAQNWSNGRVGTFGCSALGETQFTLALARHPAHRAMIVAGAGGAAGSIDNRHEYFGLFEGGVFQLASGIGWLGRHGWLRPPFRRALPVAPAHGQAFLSSLPVADLLDGTNNAWGFIIHTGLDQTADWRRLGYVMDGDPLSIPMLTINTHQDQTLSGSIALHREAQRQRQAIGDTDAARANRLIIAPGAHCDHEATAPPITPLADRPAITGDNTAQPMDAAARAGAWQSLYIDWFRFWLTDDGSAPTLAPVSFALTGQQHWHSSDHWPPDAARMRHWQLRADRSARSVRGDGRLSPLADSPVKPPSPVLEASSNDARATDWIADPLDPVPSRGGPLCCAADLALNAGPVNQIDVESRDDVLIFTSEPFTQATAFAGPATAQLYFSSDVPDADLVVRITDVDPAGRSINIQEGAQSVSGRRDIARPLALDAGEIVTVPVRIRELIWRFEPGHRLRLHVAASSFPRLARNLQSGEPSLTGSRARVGRHRLHHDDMHPSTLTLYELPAAGQH